jgi:hypothetical protein
VLRCPCVYTQQTRHAQNTKDDGFRYLIVPFSHNIEVCSSTIIQAIIFAILNKSSQIFKLPVPHQKKKRAQNAHGPARKCFESTMLETW